MPQKIVVELEMPEVAPDPGSGRAAEGLERLAETILDVARDVRAGGLRSHEGAPWSPEVVQASDIALARVAEIMRTIFPATFNKLYRGELSEELMRLANAPGSNLTQ